MPPDVADMPELFPHLQLVWQLFQVVSQSRATTFGGIFYIPLPVMIAGLDFFEVYDIDERLYYVSLLQYLDGVYVGWWHTKYAKKS